MLVRPLNETNKFYTYQQEVDERDLDMLPKRYRNDGFEERRVMGLRTMRHYMDASSVGYSVDMRPRSKRPPRNQQMSRFSRNLSLKLKVESGRNPFVTKTSAIMTNKQFVQFTQEYFMVEVMAGHNRTPHPPYSDAAAVVVNGPTISIDPLSMNYSGKLGPSFFANPDHNLPSGLMLLSIALLNTYCVILPSNVSSTLKDRLNIN